MKTATDGIIQNRNNGNYDVALLLIDLLAQDNKLPPEIQVCKVECLYALQRYFEAHEAAIKFTDEGNDMQELVFMRGLIYFALKQYESAFSIFKTNPQWAIWKEKAQAMDQISRGKYQQITFLIL